MPQTTNDKMKITACRIQGRRDRRGEETKMGKFLLEYFAMVNGAHGACFSCFLYMRFNRHLSDAVAMIRDKLVAAELFS